MKKVFMVMCVAAISLGCESLKPKSHHETGLNPEVQGHINRQKGEDMGEIIDSVFDTADILLR